MNLSLGVNNLWRAGKFAALLIAIGLAGPGTSPAADLPPLTNAVQLRQLSVSEVSRNYPVQLRGVVTYSDPSHELLVVQDDTGGAFIRVPKTDLALARGQLVSVEGRAVQDGYAPEVEKAVVRVLEKANLPKTRLVTMEEMASGRFDGQRVEVRGIVGAVEKRDGRTALHLHVGRDDFTVLLRDGGPTSPEMLRLVDARVRVFGICRMTSKINHRLPRVQVLVPHMDGLIVERAAPVNPYDAPVTLIAELSPTNTPHRVKLLARVVAVDEKNVIVEDDTGQIRVRTEQWSASRLGDLAELVGFCENDHGTPVIDHGLGRVVAPAFNVNAASHGPAVQTNAPPPLPLLQKAAEVIRLPPEEARRGYAVRLRGMITYADGPWNMLFIQDATGGIFVWRNQPELPLHPGQIVDVAGFSAPGAYIPVVIKATVEEKAEGELPAPQETEYEVLRSGQEDSQWVAVNGIVRAATPQKSHLDLDIATGAGRFTAIVSGYTDRSPITNLIDAEVRVRGVCGVIPNKRRESVGFKIFVSSLDDILVKQPAPADPWTMPLRTVRSLFGHGGASKSSHRVRVKGIVTMVREADSFFLNDNTGGLNVEGIDARKLQPGDRLEVVGFPATNERVPHLQNVIVRATGSGPAPTPRDISITQALTGKFDAELVTIKAHLVDVSRASDQPRLILQTADAIFDAALPVAEAVSALSRVPSGALLRLKGIASARFDDQGQPRTFRLLLKSPDDVQVLERPPWWDLKHALRLGGALIIVILGTFAWVWLLRKRVWEQTSTIREQLEQESRLESRYRELFENATDIVFTTDLNGHIMSFNKAAEALTGYTRAEVMGRSLVALIAPGQAQVLKPFAPGTGSGQVNAMQELEFITRAGHRISVEVCIQLLTEKGQTIGAQGIARDISDRKRAEKTVNDLNASLEKRVTERTADLEAANKELEAFSYSVSHDLRAPLRAINGFAEILLKDHSAQLEARARRYLQNVAGSGRKMGRLVDDLLAFSRLNRQALAKSPLNLDGLARGVLEDLRRYDPYRNVRVNIDSLPPGQGDPSLIQQVLYNLLSNAWKFTAKNPDAEVRIGAQQNGHGTVYFVRDNGAGFDMKYADKLFGVFQRLHRDDEFPGTGVGLAIVQRIISRHGGCIWAEAQVNEGATFYFTLPSDVAPANGAAMNTSSIEAMGAGHE